MANQNHTTKQSSYTSSYRQAFWLVFSALLLATIAQVTQTPDLLPLSGLATGGMLVLIIVYFAIIRPRMLADAVHFHKDTPQIQRKYITDDEQIMNVFWRDALKDMPCGHYVYIIRDIDLTGAYKIGRTRYPSQRMFDFGVKLPFEFAIVRIIPCEDSYALERQLHQHFANKRTRGEWFALDADDIAWIKQITDHEPEEYYDYEEKTADGKWVGRNYTP